MNWRIQLLGGLRAESDDLVVTRLPTRKMMGLLAYLAWHLDRDHPRDVLAELFWGGKDREAARRSLSAALSALRRELEPRAGGAAEPPVIIADRLRVRLNPEAVTTDVGDLRAALRSATGGGAGAGHGTRAQPASEPPAIPAGDDDLHRLRAAIDRCETLELPEYYGPWSAAEAAALCREFCAGLEHLAGLLEARGELDPALHYARRATELNPTDEGLHRLAMRLAAARGDRAGALRQFRALEERLQRELGTGPSAATRALAGELRQPEPDAGPERAHSGGPPRRGDTEPGAPRQPHPPPLTVPGPAIILPRPGDVPRGARNEPSALVGLPSLPVTLTRFFGHDEVIHRLCELLLPGERRERDYRNRLFTLTGPGGSGKTRLAIEVGKRVSHELSLWFVPLADVREPGRVVHRILHVLRLPEGHGEDPLERVAAALQRQPTLLILDNFEQLVHTDALRGPAAAGEGEAAATALVVELLNRAANLRCVITSRQRLNVTGEQEISVGPLAGPRAAPALPGTGAPGRLTPEALQRYPSVQLYIDRAQAVAPGFELTEENAAAVAALCARLEGMPLALELAAARAQVLTPGQMLARLEARTEFLVSRQRDGDPRHRTLTSVVEWSFQLLAPPLQRFLASLSVFRGGWSLEAAETVCAADAAGPGADGPAAAWTSPPSPLTAPAPIPRAEILDGLAELRDSSLIFSEHAGGEIRFRMLEMVREYGVEQLPEEELERLGRAHAGFYLGLVEAAEGQLQGPDQGLWFERLETEQPNIWAALDWCAASPDRAEMGLRFAAALWRFWWVRGYLSEGRRRLTQLLAAPALRLSREAGRAVDEAGTAALLKGLIGAGNLAREQGDHATARSLFSECLAAARGIDHRRSIAWALNSLGILAWAEGDYEQAEPLYRESLQLAREQDDRWNIAGLLNNLGEVARARGDLDGARGLYEEALAANRELGNRTFEAINLQNLAEVAHLQGNGEQARSFFEASLAMNEELGAREGIASSLIGLACVASALNDHERAIACFIAGENLCRSIGAPLPPVPTGDRDQILAAARAALGDDRFQAELERSRSLSAEEAIAMAREPEGVGG